MATNATTDKRKGWHFLPASMKLEYSDNREAKVGQTLSISPHTSPRLCAAGMHAAPTPEKASNYKKGPVLCYVEVSGDLKEDHNKFCGRNRKVIWAKKLTLEQMKEIGKDIGNPSLSSATSVSDAVSALGNGSNSEATNRALLKFAKRNGCPDVKLPRAPRKPRPKPVLPKVTARLLRGGGYLTDRDVVTWFELVRDLRADGYDVSTLPAALSAANAITLYSWNRRGTNAYVLRNTK